MQSYSSVWHDGILAARLPMNPFSTGATSTALWERSSIQARPSAEALLKYTPNLFDRNQWTFGPRRHCGWVQHRVGSGRLPGEGVTSRGAGSCDKLLFSGGTSPRALLMALVGQLLRHRTLVFDFARGSSVPAANITASHDTIVRARRSTALRDVVPAGVHVTPLESNQKECSLCWTSLR